MYNKPNFETTQMTKKEFVVHCIQHMDLDTLDIIIDENKILQGTTKSVFLNKINQVFQEFKNNGDSELTPYKGFCNAYGCKRDQGEGYSFEGNVSKKHFAIKLTESEDNKVYIENCFDFEIYDTSIEISEVISYYVYEDEKKDFVSDAKYSTLHTICSGSLTQLKNTYRNSVINKAIYLSWLAKFKLTYTALSDYSYTYSKAFEDFSNVYKDLGELSKYLEMEDSCIDAIHEFDNLNKNDEIDLLKWLVNYEETSRNLELFLLYYEGAVLDIFEESSYFEVDFLKIDLTDFKTIIRFKNLFDDFYWDMLEKYRSCDNTEDSNGSSEVKIFEKTSLSYYLNKRGIQF